MKTVLVLADKQMGAGDEALGTKILATALRKLPRFEGLETIVFYNAGVWLMTESSPVAAELRELHNAGIELLPCSTCIEHYGIQDQLWIDRWSNMDEILAALQKADKVIRL
jgi:hypothetical protein